jgi:LPXTG-motif cell wall-anchored protein
MHFIEQLFGISPDAGTGTTELLYGAVVAVLLIFAGWYVSRRRRHAAR